jgi:quercetin dioxygenase-like cupin family protein
VKVAISRTGDGEHFTRDDRDVTIRLDLPQLSVHEIEFDHTFEVPEHRHDHVDALYVLAGTVEFLSGGTSVRVGPDTLVAAPAGAPHGFRNAGPRKARVLVLHAPDGGFADRVRNSDPA